MPYSLLADLVVVVHVAFVLFVAVGGFFVARWPRLRWVHLPALGWAVGIVTVGWPCPLTGLELQLREHAGEPTYAGGFVDTYLTGVVYPASLEGVAQVVVGLAVLTSYSWALRRRRAVPG